MFNLPKRRTAAIMAMALALLAPARPVAVADTASDLKDQAAALAATHLKKFGPAYKSAYDAERHILYISALDDAAAKQAAGMLTGFADAFRARLGTAALAWNVTVILPTVDDYKPLAPSKDVVGFYRQFDHAVISIDSGRVLMHEFAHAMHHADMAVAAQKHPIWVSEGLATVYEAGKVDRDGLVPVVDLRILTLQKAIAAKGTVSLERLMKMDDAAFTKDAALCYAEAKYLMTYLHEKKALKDWYEKYKAGYDADPTGIRAMEKVLDKRIFEIDEDWQKWAAGLKMPLGELKSAQGRLGVEVADDPQGVIVASFVKDGPAEKTARLKVGDYIEQFNGIAIGSAAEFASAVRAAGALQTVNIQLRREGQRLTVAQPLGKP